MAPPRDCSAVGTKRTACELLECAPAQKQPRVVERSPREQLKEIVLALADHREDSDFPAQCASAFDETIRPFLDQHSRKDTLLLPQMRSPGKLLVHVLQLAVACKNHGAVALQTAREQLDAARVQNRRSPTRNWFAVARDLVSAKHQLFNDVKTTTWTDVKVSVHPLFDLAPLGLGENEEPDRGLDDDCYSWTGSLSDEVVACFSAAHDLESLSTDDLYASGWDEYQVGFRCDSCEKDYDPMALQFYHCESCRVDYCPGCAERQENFV